MHHGWALVATALLLATPRAVQQPVPDLREVAKSSVILKPGEEHDIHALVESLVDAGYKVTGTVEGRGELAVRGGIVDVFPPDAPHPVRLEFFGDELETLREFGVADQRSMPHLLDTIELPPSREMLLSAQVRQRAREMQHEFPSLAQMLSKIAEGIPVDGMESLAPALVDRLVPITHYLPASAAIAVFARSRPRRCRRAAARRMSKLPRHPSAISAIGGARGCVDRPSRRSGSVARAGGSPKRETR